MESTFWLAAAVLFCGIAALWLLRRHIALPKLALRLSQPKQVLPLQVLGRLHLSGQHSIQMIRAQHRVLVVGVSGSTMTLLDSFEWEGSSQEAAASERRRRIA